MAYNTLLNNKDVVKASYLREQDIFNHKDFNKDKIIKIKPVNERKLFPFTSSALFKNIM